MSDPRLASPPARTLSLIQRHPIVCFFAVTYAVGWTLWLPLVILQDQMPPALDLVLRVLGSSAPSAKRSSWSRSYTGAARCGGCCAGS